MTTRRRWLAGGAAALVIVLGGGAALAASGTDNPASSFLGDVAKKLGISETKLTDAIKAAQIDRIDAAVARGDLTKEQGDALEERVRNGDGPAILPGFRGLAPDLGAGPKLFGFGPGFRAFRFGLGLGKDDVLQAAATYLGLTQAQLREALSNGTSLADVARDRGKTVDGLEDAMKKPIRAKIDRAVEDGLLTKEQGDDLYRGLSKAVDAFVEADVGGPPGLGLRGLGLPGLGNALGHRGGLFGFGLGPGTADVVEAAADYLGLSVDELSDALRAGKTPARVAEEKGKSVDGLKSAVKTAIRAEVDKAVEDGLLTKEQGDRLYGSLAETADGFVDRGFGRLRFRFGDRRGGFRFEFRLDGDRPSARIEGDVQLPPVF
jgi:hypothetical protein